MVLVIQLFIYEALNKEKVKNKLISRFELVIVYFAVVIILIIIVTSTFHI